MKLDGGGPKLTTKIKGELTPVQNRVLVSHMHFGEQKTAGGLIIRSDDGETRGIYPRWGKVYAKGPTNDDPYKIGDWVLVEHGRWTRGIELEQDSGVKLILRMVEAESILAVSDEKPDDVTLGKEYNDGAHADIDPQQFVNVQ
jgi:co-chaperonin GroES (HSP10)